VINTGRTRLATAKIRYALGIVDRPNSESINNNGCNIYDSFGKILWENVLPTNFIIKYHNLLKSYPNSVYRYTYGNCIVPFCKKRTGKKNSYLPYENLIVEEDEHLEKIKSGEKSDINKVGYLYMGPECKSKGKKLFFFYLLIYYLSLIIFIIIY